MNTAESIVSSLLDILFLIMAVMGNENWTKRQSSYFTKQPQDPQRKDSRFSNKNARNDSAPLHRSSEFIEYKKVSAPRTGVNRGPSGFPLAHRRGSGRSQV